MANPIEYIVYEPDQVLTNEHLNETFNYLDQQNRWTRNKLIGIGIVCGLDIVLNPSVIGVTKGCGVTSQGYLIIQDAAQYTYYIAYTGLQVPQDLPFTYPYGDLPFYAPYCTGKTIYQLLTDDQFNALESAQQLNAKTISSASTSFLQDYAVVLFLEANETDLKNCSMQDCNNKGEKMAFVVRPLLVPKKDLPTVKKQQPTNTGTTAQPVNQNLPHEINFKRYNVPYTTLNNSDDVLNAFVKIVDDATLTQVSNAYNYCYQTYTSILKVTTNPFTGMLALLQKYRTEILANDPVFIEYYYDFINDLIKAFYEFSYKVTNVISTCCPDENLFPLHLVLGGATSASSSLTLDSYRTYFIYSPLFSKMGSESAEVVLLFNRMVIMLNQFNDPTRAVAFERKDFIQITPSQYELPWLSERAIPYYYNVNVAGSELYKSWSYYKTSRGNAGFNLGYFASEYNTNTAVTSPLLYDIEHYNFFRVEGHIGLKYQTVLSNILSQRQNYNLPFDVVAISADLLRGTATLPQCNFLDLETDYKLILSEAACKIHTIFCFISKLPYQTSATGVFTGVFDAPPASSVTPYSAFRLQADTIDATLLSSSAYVKGDFMRTYCAPAANTIGSAYLASLNKTGVFTNRVQINQSDATTGVYFYFLQFIDAVEELMLTLVTSTVAGIDMTVLETKYKNFLLYVTRAIEILALQEERATATDATAANANFITLVQATELDMLIDEMAILLTLCTDERLQILIAEYKRRLALYQSQHTFLNYYKNHPGLEHKGGVPKGGTLVLVYHSEQATLSTNSGATFTRNPVLVADEPIAVKGTATSVTFDKSTIDLLKSFVNDCEDAPADKKQKLIDILSFRPPVQRTFEITDGTVIADFYIPYLCCSDCPPTAYILPADTTTTPPPTQGKPVITMDTTFCDDVKTADISVSIPGGTFNTVKGLNAANLTFSPATAGPGTYSIIYTVNGVSSDPVTVTVLDIPVNTFTFTKGFSDKQIPQATFTADAKDAGLVYNWQFGPGFSPSQANTQIITVDIQMSPAGGLIDTTVSLQVSNGKCANAPVVEQFTIGPNGMNPATAAQPKDEGIISEIENFFTKKKKKK